MMGILSFVLISLFTLSIGYMFYLHLPRLLFPAKKRASLDPLEEEVSPDGIPSIHDIAKSPYETVVAKANSFLTKFDPVDDHVKQILDSVGSPYYVYVVTIPETLFVYPSQREYVVYGEDEVEQLLLAICNHRLSPSYVEGSLDYISRWEKSEEGGTHRNFMFQVVSSNSGKYSVEDQAGFVRQLKLI